MTKETMNKILNDIEEQFNNLTIEQFDDYSCGNGLLTIVDNAFEKVNINDSMLTADENIAIMNKYDECYKKFVTKLQ